MNQIEETLEILESFITDKKLEEALDKIAADNEVDYLEAIAIFVEENEIDYEDINPIILGSKSIKEKIEFAAIKSGKIKSTNIEFNI